MDRRPEPTPEVARARRYAARVRIAVALTGGALLVVQPEVALHPAAAAVGLAVIGLTGLVEWFDARARWLAVEETLSCAAVISIVGVNEGSVDIIWVLWLVAAATGVLARGGRVAPFGRLIVIGTLLSPLVTTGGMSAEAVGFALASTLLFLAAGRISRETGELLVRARHDADHDALTGLLAPRAFRAEVDRLSGIASHDRPVGLVALDLDGLGAVNKRLGHAAGDRTLVETAEAMRSVLRDADVLGRLGGDEFAALVHSDDPHRIARRLIAAVGERAEGCTACAGVATGPRDGIGAEALLAAADVALRVAKRSTAGTVGVYDGMPISEGADGARPALERLSRGEDVWMAAQPIVDVRDGKVHAFEALARFSTRGAEGPLHWFALADEFGLRADLELACLRAAVGLAPALPRDARLSVNLSAPLLVDPRTTEIFEGLDRPERLIVEVTEDTLVRHGEAIDETLSSLRERGVRFAVDDVGAGYSGLSQLAALRPTYLKLDRALARGIDRDPSRMALMRSLADYARATEGLLVAEGVETAAELAHVRAAGAALVQGFLMARPAPPWPRVSVAGLEALRYGAPVNA
ncbi:MAG: bifunctional diguanylate cyclase/phosphodiesterase [Thermoleophilaceae bacterium]|nr:bifunctional diguanylate cyclase/phosphodiesterase [Thermoleophilaceae bacterium]